MGVVTALARLMLLMVTLVAAACSSNTAGATPPTAQEILNKPYTATVKDAHFTLAAHVVTSSTTFDATGDGWLVVKPQQAMRFTMLTTASGQPLKFETIIIGGKEYALSPDNPRWVVTSSTSSSNPSSLFKGTGATLLGEDTLSQGKAWHVKAKDANGNPFEAWVREADGYPLKYASTMQGSTFTATFDRFNTGQTVSAPPASDIQPSG
jgi:outer membrane lipoprotein-sorting protein